MSVGMTPLSCLGGDGKRQRVRFTLQPMDAPDNDPAMLARTLEHVASDELLLFSTDYPHWQFEGDDVLPAGLPETTMRKLLIDNPLDAYPRLGGTVAPRTVVELAAKEAP